MPSFEYTPFWHHQVSKFKILASKEYRRPLVALFGDSITEGFQGHEFLPQYSFANRGISGDVTEAALLRLNESILDLYPYFADQQGELSASFTLDGLHLNGLAYQVWADVLDDILKSM